MTGKNRKSWKKEAEYLQRKVNELKEEITGLKNNSFPRNNSKEVIDNNQSPLSQNPKILKKVEKQEEKNNVLEINEEQEPIEKEKKEEIFSYECPECNKKFNELNEGCCPYCNAQLENAD